MSPAVLASMAAVALGTPGPDAEQRPPAAPEAKKKCKAAKAKAKAKTDSPVENGNGETVNAEPPLPATTPIQKAKALQKSVLLA